MYNRIYWQDGTLLTAKHFELQDTLHYQTLSQAVSLPYQMEYGVAKLVIDFRLLELGTIKIDELLLYTKEKFFIYHVSKGPLKLKISEDNTSPIVSIYVSSKDISTEKDDLPLLTPHYYLSDKPDENVAHQFKLLELLNVNKKWQLNDYSPALISCASSTLAYTLDELAKLLISVKHFIEHQQGNINNHYLLQTQFHSCEKLLQACTNTSTHFHPYSLFDGFENLYFLITLIEEISTKSFGYDFYRPHQSFKALLNAFYEILKKPIRQQLTQFDPKKYFPGLFFPIYKTLATNAREIYEHIAMHSNSLQWHIAKQMYATDDMRFLKDLPSMAENTYTDEQFLENGMPVDEEHQTTGLLDDQANFPDSEHIKLKEFDEVGIDALAVDDTQELSDLMDDIESISSQSELSKKATK